MELRLRRYTGVASEGRTTRLHVYDCDDARLGFVHVETGWLYLLHEEQREEIRQELQGMGVEVTGPEVSALVSLPWLADCYLSPASRGRVKLLSQYDGQPDPSNAGYEDGVGSFCLTTLEKLPPPLLGEYHSRYGQLSLCNPIFRQSAVGHLRRLGAVPLDYDPPLLGVDVRYKKNGSTCWQDGEYRYRPEPIERWRPGQVTPEHAARWQQKVQSRQQAEADFEEARNNCGYGLTDHARSLLPVYLQELGDDAIKDVHLSRYGQLCDGEVNARTSSGT